MSIYHLNAGDFSQEGGHLVANIGGITFIMFSSAKCTYCTNFLSEFEVLAGSIRGVNFGLCDVSKHAAVVTMASNSSTPMKGVPKFILYNDGIPYVEYSGQRNRNSIINFLQEIITKLNQKQPFARPRRTRQNEGGQEMQQPQQSGGVGGAISRPPSLVPPGQASMQQQDPQNKSYLVTPTTGVREYETSYGMPYNAHNEKEFLDYEQAYKAQMAAAVRK